MKASIGSARQMRWWALMPANVSHWVNGGAHPSPPLCMTCTMGSLHALCTSHVHMCTVCIPFILHIFSLAISSLLLQKQN